MKKIFRYFLVVLLIFFIILFGAYWYYIRAINEKNSGAAEKLRFVVQQGETSEDISKQLKDAGLIRSNLFFDLYAWQSGNDDKLQSGEYDIPKNLSIKDVIRLLSSAKERLQNKITIIEGWKISDIAQYFDDNAITKKENFVWAVEHKAAWWDRFELLKNKPRDRDLEGYLFPDTYLVYKDASIDDIIEKMLSNLEKKYTPEMRDETKRLGFSTHEILTLASIIEREVSTDDDRAVVSGIFHNRLKAGMGLQSDATVNYVTGKGKTQPSYDDVSVDSPYNTYKYRGLPPGPIGSPGLSAIRAALYPKESEYIYFLTTPEGKAIYSKTYEEHIIAKRKYLQ